MMLNAAMLNSLPVIRIAGHNYIVLDDAPWTWQGNKADVYTNVWYIFIVQCTIIRNSFTW